MQNQSNFNKVMLYLRMTTEDIRKELDKQAEKRSECIYDCYSCNWPYKWCCCKIVNEKYPWRRWYMESETPKLDIVYNGVDRAKYQMFKKYGQFEECCRQ